MNEAMEKRETVNAPPKGLVIAGLRGGSGKSVVAVGLTAALAARGRDVCPFKKGPDYIDAGWMQLAAGRSCYNLDPYLMERQTILTSCRHYARGSEMVLVEGNRGLFDGVDVGGSYSTAELASILNLPVLLVVDCTKATRTVAALLMGCQQLDPSITISGCVLNRIGSSRHERIIRQAVEHYTDITVVGAIRRLGRDIFPQRHIGITPCPEYAGALEAVNDLAELISESVDLDLAETLMTPLDMGTLHEDGDEELFVEGEEIEPQVRIGVIKDAAFQFYYPENLEALERNGARLVEVNALQDDKLPEVDGLYIGGGFPETSVRELSANERFRKSVKGACEAGLPVYAECGGLIYLGRGMEVDGHYYPLAGVFESDFVMTGKPQAHGYTILEASAANPFYPKGTPIKGHEFRYSRVSKYRGEPKDLALSMKRGVGFMEKRDGLVFKNTLALYTHVHTFGTPEWAVSFVNKVRKWKNEKEA